MQLDQRLDDRQAEAAPRPVAVARPVEAVERVARLLLGHPAPGVGHVERNVVAVVARCEGQRPALVGIEVRVRQQVRHHLADARRVGERRRQLGGQLEFEPLLLAVHARPDQRDDLVDHLAQVGRAQVDLGAAGFDAGDVEQVVDEVDEPVRRHRDDLGELALAVG